MRTPYRVAIVSALAILVPLSSAHAAKDEEFGDHARPGVTEMVSVASDGTQGDASSGAHCGVDGPSISDDGRFVAFTSLASNLDDRDINGKHLPDVYLHDRKTGRTTLVSVTSRGVSIPAPPGEGIGCLSTPTGVILGSYDPAISGDGRFIAFASAGQALGATDPSGGVVSGIYVHDRVKGTTELASPAFLGAGTTGLTLANGPSVQPAISQDGRYVSFASIATNLVKDSPCAESLGALPVCNYQLYVYDRKTEEMKLVSKTSEGDPAPLGVPVGTESRHGLSDNGRFAVFASKSNLTPNDQDICTPALGCYKDVFVADVKTGEIELISVGRSGTSTEASDSNLMVPAQAQSISADGRFVVFESNSKDLVPANSPLYGTSVYVRDREKARTERITASTGEYLAGTRASISDDGRFVMQFAHGGTVITGEASGEWSGETAAIVRHDRRTGQTDMVQIKIWRGEDQGGQSWDPVISGSGRHFVWTSGESHGFKDDNDAYDVFVRDLGAVPAFGSAFIGSDAGGLGIDGAKRFTDTGVLSLTDGVTDRAQPIEGGEIIGGRLAYRAKYDDLYARIELDRLAGLSASPVVTGAPIVYGLEFRLDDVRYEVRAAGGLVPRFGLFRCVPSETCTEVGSLRGGYGTAGESVIVALPLDLLGRDADRQISGLKLFSALGTYELGPRVTIDQAAVRGS